MKTNQDIKNKKYLHHEKVYAGFDETKDCFIYIGGRHYDDVAQIHLSKTEAKALHSWLSKIFPRRKPRGKLSQELKRVRRSLDIAGAHYRGVNSCTRTDMTTLARRIEAAIEEAVAEENEECAKLVDSLTEKHPQDAEDFGYVHACADIVREIRARGEVPRASLLKKEKP